jgi:hypothetical protein
MGHKRRPQKRRGPGYPRQTMRRQNVRTLGRAAAGGHGLEDTGAERTDHRWSAGEDTLRTARGRNPEQDTDPIRNDRLGW